MKQAEILQKIYECIVNLDVGTIRRLVREALEVGIPAYKVFMEGMAKGMDIVGRKYEMNEYFLAELIMAAEVMKEGMVELTPFLKMEGKKHLGKVVIGTVLGDIHDIGKNIVKTLLISAGFEVYDLGVDVPAKEFVKKVKETNAEIVALSALLTTTMGEMRTVIEELKNAGLREKVKVIIGGAPITDEFAREIGADAAAKDAAHGVRICKNWIGG